MPGRWFAGLILLVAIASCQEAPPVALGLLASDRIEIVADASEPIIEMLVAEGDRVDSGQLLIVMDARRVDAQLMMVQATESRLKARLAELENGPRAEEIAVLKSQIQAAVLDKDYREVEWLRQARLSERGLGVAENLDLAKVQFDIARSRLDTANAQLQLLMAGTRFEHIEQARYELQQTQAHIAALHIDRERLYLRAPVPGYIDSLPFEAGEQPRQGDVLAVLLAGEQPHARVYVPETLRVGVKHGDRVHVYIDGIEGEVIGEVRRIVSEASFTPYYSLSAGDRGRLSYLAEIALPSTPERLPDGVPLEVRFGAE
ncbi:MAG: HlyD family efflux transporter periplasmic adaptor subunit [Gammaproteobacteria bacterium]|nr:HlyD family efflux transporter periplasmic adaptor subunit [Gammaproteobacteria bacterium]MDP2142237.1 HlyD family efflux transporter periplasmic adaptor subunit [Gammaproteobacteria bacterium]MDP2347886.1 HlyD family efflux transporter periplasmic adaptor subunit [Gammaproteobacteria bacterium]